MNWLNGKYVNLEVKLNCVFIRIELKILKKLK
jgi:hypothetical protein